MIPDRTKDQMEKLAERFLQRASQLSPPIDPARVANCLGITVLFAQFKEPETLSLLNRSKMVIYIDIDANPGKMRFGIAHQLGHWILHNGSDVQYDSDKTTRISGFHDATAEAEADYLARTLLAPRQWVQEARARGGLWSRPSVLATHFSVPLGVMSDRLRDLGIESKYRVR